MSSLQIIFSILIIFIPLFSIFYRNAFFLYPLVMIGASPYITALSFILFMLSRLNTFFNKQNIHLVVITSLWLSWGLLLFFINQGYSSIDQYIQVGISFLISIFAYQNLNKKSEIVLFCKYIFSSGIFLCLLEIFISIFNIDIFSALIDTRPRSYTSIYILFSIVPVVFLIEKRNWLRILALFFALSVIFINEGRSIYLAAIVVFGFYYIRKIPFYLSVVLIGLFAFLLAIYISFNSQLLYVNSSIFSLLNTDNNFSNLERLSLLNYAFTRFVENPFGYGVGSSQEIFSGNLFTVLDHYPHPHNSLAFLAIELGIVGIFIYFYLLISLYITIRKIQDNELKVFGLLLLLAIFIASLANTLFYNGLITIFTFLIVGMIFSLRKIDQNAQRHQ